MKKKIVLFLSAVVLCLVTFLTACTNYTSSLVFYEIQEEGQYYTFAVGEVAVVEDKDYYLTHLVIPQTYNGKPVTIIGVEAFKCHDKLTEIEIPEGIKYIDDFAFVQCYGLTKVKLPDTLLILGHGVFEKCGELKSIIIEKNIKTIYNRSFIDCTKLQDVYYKGTQEDWEAIDIREFNDCLLNADIHFSE